MNEKWTKNANCERPYCCGLTDLHGLMGWVVVGTGTGSDAPTRQFSNEPKNSPNGSEMTEI